MKLLVLLTVCIASTAGVNRFNKTADGDVEEPAIFSQNDRAIDLKAIGGFFFPELTSTTTTSRPYTGRLPMGVRPPRNRRPPMNRPLHPTAHHSLPTYNYTPSLHAPNSYAPIPPVSASSTPASYAHAPVSASAPALYAPTSYAPAPASYASTPASYAPASYAPAPASYAPAPASYAPAPASYEPAPAPASYAPASAAAMGSDVASILLQMIAALSPGATLIPAPSSGHYGMNAPAAFMGSNAASILGQMMPYTGAASGPTNVPAPTSYYPASRPTPTGVSFAPVADNSYRTYPAGTLNNLAPLMSTVQNGSPLSSHVSSGSRTSLCTFT